MFSLKLKVMLVITFNIPMTIGEKSAVQAVEALRPNTLIPIHLEIQPRRLLLKTG